MRASDLADPRGAGQWLAFGWGDRGFYIDAPTWRQARLSTIATALTGSGATVMHVDHLGAFAADENWRPLRLRPAEYRRLAAFIAATLADGPRVHGPRCLLPRDRPLQRAEDLQCLAS